MNVKVHVTVFFSGSTPLSASDKPVLAVDLVYSKVDIIIKAIHKDISALTVQVEG